MNAHNNITKKRRKVGSDARDVVPVAARMATREGLIYDTEKAQLIAYDHSKSGVAQDADTRLYRTPHGRYFLYGRDEESYLKALSERRPNITPLEPEKALSWFNELPCKVLDFRDAFPEMTFEDA